MGKNILSEFIDGPGRFLIEDCGLSQVKSTEGTMGCDEIVLQKGDVEIRLGSEWTNRVFFEMRSIVPGSLGSMGGGLESWFSLDILRMLLTGEPSASPIVNPTEEMGEENLRFLQDNIVELMRRFGESRINETEAECCRLRRERSKRR